MENFILVNPRYSKELMILYKFEASWCNPCKQLARTLANNVDPSISSLVKVIDVDSEDPLIEKYNIRNVPVLLFVNDEGTDLGRLVGAINAKAITDKYNSLLNSDN